MFETLRSVYVCVCVRVCVERLVAANVWGASIAAALHLLIRPQHASLDHKLTPISRAISRPFVVMVTRGSVSSGGFCVCVL